LYIFIIISIILIDQYIKYIVVGNISVNDSIPVIGSFFQISHIHNYGAAFSILQDKQVFLIATVSVLCIVLFAFLILKRKAYHWSLVVAISMIIGGGVGNLIDRIRLGYVIDFLRFGTFPVFNFADMCVVCGSGLLIIYIVIIEPRGIKNGVANNGKRTSGDYHN
jgi:signal peptidase II